MLLGRYKQFVMLVLRCRILLLLEQNARRFDSMVMKMDAFNTSKFLLIFEFAKRLLQQIARLLSFPRGFWRKKCPTV